MAKVDQKQIDAFMEMIKSVMTIDTRIHNARMAYMAEMREYYKDKELSKDSGWSICVPTLERTGVPLNGWEGFILKDDNG